MLYTNDGDNEEAAGNAYDTSFYDCHGNITFERV